MLPHLIRKLVHCGTDNTVNYNRADVYPIAALLGFSVLTEIVVKGLLIWYWISTYKSLKPLDIVTETTSCREG